MKFHCHMSEPSRPVSLDRPVRAKFERPQTLTSLRRWLGVLQLVIPIGLVLLVVIYEAGPAEWIYQQWGLTSHYIAEVVFYGSVGPILAFGLLHLLARWIEERETSDLQAQVLARARERARLNRELIDDTLQSLFAVSVLLASLRASSSELPPEASAILSQTQRSLDESIRRLREHLLA